MQDEITVHIKSDQSIYVDIIKNGIVKTKQIKPDTLLDCVRNSLQKDTRITTGLLPQNVLSFTINPYEGNQYVVMEFPDTHADITYMKTTYEQFPLPRLLFGFTVQSSGRISSVKLGVPASGKLTTDTKMFYYPFSNVSTFSMCVGSNEMPNIKTLISLTNLPYFIMGIPNNDDHFDEKHNKLHLCHRELLEHLRDKDRNYYYEQVLIPMPNTTLKNFL